MKQSVFHLFLIFCFMQRTLASVSQEVILDSVQNVWDLVAGDEEAFERELGNEQDAFIRNPGIQNYTASVIDKHGYRFEEYEVTTPDGYLLTVFRVVGKIGAPVVPGKKVVFVQHGLLMSSADWVIAGPEKALAFILSDAGYDVWLGNARGNTHSRKHLYLSPNKRAFWDFSWHEIGQIDLPAMIDHALQVSGQTKLHYIGHSQGSTAFFVMGALRKDMMPKIISMHALAPVAFMGNIKSPFLRVLAPFVFSIDWITSMLGIHEFFPSNKMMKKGGYFTCRDESIFQELCANALFLIGGYNSAQLNRTMLPEILKYTPAGSSRHQLVHYGQEVNSGKFRMFDFGMFGNLAKYGSMKPPKYDLSKITAPVALHYGDNDWLAAVKDVDKLANSLPKLIGKFRVGDAKCNHFDFLWGINAPTMIYDRVLSLMERYE